jgi:CPA1 family monovalent cation:H+ antiporter
MLPIQELIAVFLGIVLLATVVSKRVKIPYTILLVLVGLALAASPFALSGVVDAFNGLINSDLFVGLILTPLLFESIMSVRVEDFRAVYRPALLMATAGVLIATLVGGVVLWRVVGVVPIVAFLFAAIISPTDVATTLEVFSRVNVPARLATLVEMESVFNDASGIAIFTIFLASSAATSSVQPLGAFVTFTYVLGVGVLVGLGMAWLGRQLQRLIDDSVTQIVLTLVAVYGAYALASLLSASGLIAVAVTGLFYGNSIILRLESKKVAEATREFWRVLAFIANAVAFFYIGVSTNIFLLASSIGAVLVAYGIVVMARISSVYPILSLDKVGGSFIPASWMNTATLGGMRGALAIALVSAIPADSRGPVATLVFGVVVLSILLQGPLLTRYTRRAFGRQEKLPIPEKQEPSMTEEPAQPLSPTPETQAEDAVR